MELPDLGSMNISEIQNDQTDTEKEIAQVHTELLKLTAFIAGSKETSPEQADIIVGKVGDWLQLKKAELTLTEARSSSLISATALSLQSDSPSAPTWVFFHSVFNYLETIKALSQLVNLASRKSSRTTKLLATNVERLATLLVEVTELIRSNVRALKHNISQPGVLTSLVDLVVLGDESDKSGKELQQTLEAALDVSKVEIFCGSLMESWEEALDGVNSVRL